MLCLAQVALTPLACASFSIPMICSSLNLLFISFCSFYLSRTTLFNCPVLGDQASADEKAVRQTWDYLASVIPMKRMGEAEEVAKAVLFLSSDDSSFTTGTELQVDGGSVDLNLFEGNKYERRE